MNMKTIGVVVSKNKLDRRKFPRVINKKEHMEYSERLIKLFKETKETAQEPPQKNYNSYNR